MIHSVLRKTMVAAVAVTMLSTMTAPAQAQRWLGCRSKIEAAHHAIELAIAHYGNDSRRARARQHEYNDARMWCWRTYKGWWDERYNRWRTDRWSSFS